MNIDEELSRVGLTREQYEAYMDDVSDKVNGLNDMDWGEIQEKYNINFSSDNIRKANSRPFGAAFAKEYYSNKKYTDTEQMAAIRKEKQKLYDERAALNKINRDNSRIEQDLNYLAELIKQNSYSSVLVPNIKRSDNDLLIAISDVHLGLDVNNNFGKYNSDIANERFSQYLGEIFKIQKLHNSEKAFVGLCGDLISGSIHQTVQLENRENVVEQIQKVSEMISAFIYELSKNFNEVYINSVAGNHSRVNPKKDQVLRDERLDDLCLWYLKAKLNNLKNVFFVDDKNYDSTIGVFYIRDKEYLLCHGDYDSFSESGISKLVMMIGHKFAGLLVGHLHRCSLDEIAGVKILRSGSFSGAIDNYTVQKRISGNPSQLVCVINSDGIEALYPICLK